ncbi:MmgE/PrpD family protein [Billgrantia gudaonensis]|nr:MmgE/PrpD family protein [Halomonas gudaonensis]
MTATDDLVRFVTNLSFDELPSAVVETTQNLMLDWLGSGIAGRHLHPTPCFGRVVEGIAPGEGACDILTGASRRSSFAASMINAAAGNIVEQNDLHNASILHPGAVVFPVVLALAQERGLSGRDTIVAAVAGYEAGIRVGECLGASHYRCWHTTATVGTLAAAMAAGRAMRLDHRSMLHALGSAGTQASGLWAFIHDDADSRPLHAAKAASNGLLAAALAQQGVTGASDILLGRQGMGEAMSDCIDADRLVDGLGRRWGVLETSLKYHASCRHTHPGADAFVSLCKDERLAMEDIVGVSVGVHRGALDVLNPSVAPETISEAKFSMGCVLGLLAHYGSAGVEAFTLDTIRNPRVRDFAKRVTMAFDPEVDAAYPRKWVGKVVVTTRDRRTIERRLDHPKGDPQNPLSEEERLAKFRCLADAGGLREVEAVDRLIDWTQTLSQRDRVGSLMQWLA